MTTPLTTAGDQATKAPVGLREPECASAMIDGLCVGNGHGSFHVSKQGAVNKHAWSVSMHSLQDGGIAGEIHPRGVPIGVPPLSHDASGPAVNVSQHKRQEN